MFVELEVVFSFCGKWIYATESINIKSIFARQSFITYLVFKAEYPNEVLGHFFALYYRQSYIIAITSC